MMPERVNCNCKSIGTASMSPHPFDCAEFNPLAGASGSYSTPTPKYKPEAQARGARTINGVTKSNGSGLTDDIIKGVGKIKGVRTH